MAWWVLVHSLVDIPISVALKESILLCCIPTTACCDSVIKVRGEEWKWWCVIFAQEEEMEYLTFAPFNRNIILLLISESLTETQPVRTASARCPFSSKIGAWAASVAVFILSGGAAGTSLVNYLKFCATLRGRADKDDRRCVAGVRRDEEDAAVSLPAFGPPSANHVLRLRLMDGPAVPKPWARPNAHTQPPPPPPRLDR